MEKPVVTRNMSRIAMILAILDIAVPCGAAIFSLASGATVGDVLFNIIISMTTLPLVFLALWHTQQTEISQSSATTSLYLTAAAYVVSLILSFFLRIAAVHVLSYEFYRTAAFFSRLQGISRFCGVAAVLLLFSAGAIEYALTAKMPSEEISHKLSLYAFIAFGACLLLVCGMLFLTDPILTAIQHYPLALPMKWKLIVLGSKLLWLLPMLYVAWWSFRTQERTDTVAMMKLVFAIVPYFGLSLMSSVAVSFFQKKIIYAEGQEVFASFSLTMNILSYLGFAAFVGLVLLTCAAAIELYAVKYAPERVRLSKNDPMPSP